MKPPTKKLISARDLQREYVPGIALKTLYSYAAARKIPSYRVGTKVLFDPVEVMRHIETHGKLKAIAA